LSSCLPISRLDPVLFPPCPRSFAKPLSAVYSRLLDSETLVNLPGLSFSTAKFCLQISPWPRSPLLPGTFCPSPVSLKFSSRNLIDQVLAFFSLLSPWPPLPTFPAGARFCSPPFKIGIPGPHPPLDACGCCPCTYLVVRHVPPLQSSLIFFSFFCTLTIHPLPFQHLSLPQRIRYVIPSASPKFPSFSASKNPSGTVS